MTRRLTPLAAVALLMLTACGGTTDDEPDAANEDTTAPSSTPAEPTRESTPETPRATCTLKGKQSAKVTLEDTGDDLVATFDGQPVTDRGTVLYSVTAWDEAGEVGVQLGMKYLDGEQIGYFVFDYVTSEQTNLDGSPEVNGKAVRGTFPDDALGDLADAGAASWSAAFNVNGNDVGTCPGGIDSLPFPG
jgi:hypothetical protein